MKTNLLSILIVSAVSMSAFAQAGEDLPAFDSRPLMAATTPVNGTNEIQTITLGGTPTGGTFTLTYQGSTTGAITWTATDATLVSRIDTALEALGRIGTSGVVTAAGTVSSGIGTITVTFSGTNNARKNVSQMTATSSLTGTSPTVAVTTTTGGVEADGRISKKGTLCVALDTGVWYANTGTPPNPTWVKVSAQ